MDSLEEPLYADQDLAVSTGSIPADSKSSQDRPGQTDRRHDSLNQHKESLTKPSGHRIDYTAYEQPMVSSAPLQNVVEHIYSNPETAPRAGWENNIQAATLEEDHADSQILLALDYEITRPISEGSFSALTVNQTSPAGTLLNVYDQTTPVILDRPTSESSALIEPKASRLAAPDPLRSSARPTESPLALNKKLFAKIEKINHRINVEIIPRTDQNTYGTEEHWTLPLTFGQGRFGDCEDYALEKREALLKAGIPLSAMYFAVANSRAIGRHALLMLSTDIGDYVLDNVTSEIRPWQETDYTWLSRQSSENPLEWASTETTL